MKKTTKCAVASVNSNGEPDFYFVMVRGTEDQFDNGLHIKLAADAARDNGYDPVLVYDDAGPAGRAIMPLFAWETADTVEIVLG